jgi:hypothetical protein
LTGLISQSSSNPPTIIELVNTLNVPYTLEYTTTGDYMIHADSPVFTEDKTFVLFNPMTTNVGGGFFSKDIVIEWVDGTRVRIVNTKGSDDVLLKACIEIRVYN